MKRALLPCLLVGLFLVAIAPAIQAETDFYMDVRIGNSGYYPQPGRVYYPPQSQPYNDLRVWVRYEQQRWRQYDHWWRAQSYYYKAQTRMQHDYGQNLYDNMRRYPNWTSIQQLENFLRRYYNPTAYNYDNVYYRDPYYGGNNTGYRNDYYYPDDSYYYNAPRRAYYGNEYNYNSYSRERDIHSYGAGESIGHIVSGGANDNGLEIAAGTLGTVGNILNLVNNENQNRNRYPDFGRRW